MYPYKVGMPCRNRAHDYGLMPDPPAVFIEIPSSLSDQVSAFGDGFCAVTRRDKDNELQAQLLAWSTAESSCGAAGPESAVQSARDPKPAIFLSIASMCHDLRKP